jgi:hypothetical protein
MNQIVSYSRQVGQLETQVRQLSCSSKPFGGPCSEPFRRQSSDHAINGHNVRALWSEAILCVIERFKTSYQFALQNQPP